MKQSRSKRLNTIIMAMLASKTTVSTDLPQQDSSRNSAIALVSPRRRSLIAGLSILVLIAGAAHTQNSNAQQALESGEVQPMGRWLEFREVAYSGGPILLHLRQGYERAIVMPEPVVQENELVTLPGTEIVIQDNVIAFYPTRAFTRRPVVFVGTKTGAVYELQIRATTKGMRQPLRINR